LITDNTWSGGALVATGTIKQAESSLAVEADGTAHLVWTEAHALHYAQVSAGTVSASQTLTGSNAYTPRISVDGAGQAHVLWRQSDISGHKLIYLPVGGSAEAVPTGNCPIRSDVLPVNFRARMSHLFSATMSHLFSATMFHLPELGELRLR
jgi:hypothetical protein